MKTLTITKKDIENEKYTNKDVDFDGHIKIAAVPEGVFFASLKASGHIFTDGGIKTKRGISAGGSVEARKDINVSEGINTGCGIKAGGSLFAREDISAGGSIKVGGGISAGWSIAADGSINTEGDIEASGGIQARWDIQSSRGDICAGADLYAGGEIKAGEEMEIKCRYLLNGTVTRGKLTVALGES